MKNYCPSCPFKNKPMPPGHEGEYYCGERCLEEGSAVNFEEDLQPVLTAERGTLIADPMTRETRIELAKELKGVDRAQYLGRVTAIRLGQ